MKLKTEDIPLHGLELQSVLEKNCLEEISKKGKEGGIQFQTPVSFSLKITKSGRDIFLLGSISTSLLTKCSRCAKEFEHPLVFDFKYTLCPTKYSDTDNDIELNSEDLEFSFYHGEEIDIFQIIQEQIALFTPFKPLCNNSCRGLCFQCGEDLNEKTCKCSERTLSNIGFSKLQDFEIDMTK